MPPELPPPARKPLTRCCACGCGLAYPVAVRTGSSGRAIVTRRCPECELVDIVTCSALAAIAWLRREAAVRARVRAVFAEA